MRFVLHAFAPAARRMRRDEFREDLRDGRRVSIRFDPGIACHDWNQSFVSLVRGRTERM